MSFFFSFLTKNNRRKVFKNIILLTATHLQTTIKITTVLCLSRTLAMWMLWMHLPFLALCRTEFWDWNLLFPLFKATLPARHWLPLGKVPVWNTKWISRKWQRERKIRIASLIHAPYQQWWATWMNWGSSSSHIFFFLCAWRCVSFWIRLQIHLVLKNTADYFIWQQYYTPILSSTTEFGEHEKIHLMNRFHYAYILSR